MKKIKVHFKLRNSVSVSLLSQEFGWEKMKDDE